MIIDFKVADIRAILPQTADHPQGRRVTHRAVIKASDTYVLAVAAIDLTMQATRSCRGAPAERLIGNAGEGRR